MNTWALLLLPSRQRSFMFRTEAVNRKSFVQVFFSFCQVGSLLNSSSCSHLVNSPKPFLPSESVTFPSVGTWRVDLTLPDSWRRQSHSSSFFDPTAQGLQSPKASWLRPTARRAKKLTATRRSEKKTKKTPWMIYSSYVKRNTNKQQFNDILRALDKETNRADGPLSFLPIKIRTKLRRLFLLLAQASCPSFKVALFIRCNN